MERNITPEMQNQLRQIQQIQQQLEFVIAQRSQIDSKIKELEKSIEELGKAKKDTPIYKSIGSVLIKANNKEDVSKELEEEKEKLGITLKTIEKQQKMMEDRYKSFQQEIAKAYQEMSS